MFGSLEISLDEQVRIRVEAGGGHHEVLWPIGAAEFEPPVPMTRNHALNRVAVFLHDAVDAVVSAFSGHIELQRIVDEYKCRLVLAELRFEPVELFFAE